ncbi:hypothetical protein EDP2_3965 [Enterobacter cloacae S611]|uniref:Uncharacterized protein n=1 Tax=Enterobacter cloacae S611 TaxID=1399146 RepID=A0ABP2ZRZ1_ENTCL|nr:hypothetical protein EDP2_3965 [Enterobacter cloacae S611]
MQQIAMQLMEAKTVEHQHIGTAFQQRSSGVNQFRLARLIRVAEFIQWLFFQHLPLLLLRCHQFRYRHNHADLVTINNRGNQRGNDALRFNQNGISRV